jgi:hypothetical protein
MNEDRLAFFGDISDHLEALPSHPYPTRSQCEGIAATRRHSAMNCAVIAEVAATYQSLCPA